MLSAGLPGCRILAVLGLACAVLVPTGCVSKTQADSRARAAFAAGQQRAVMMSRQVQGPTVTVIGAVRNPLLPWTTDLTLAKAVIAADYYGRTDPAEIVIQRNGQELRYEVRQLLSGTDVQLEPSDVILLK